MAKKTSLGLKQGGTFTLPVVAEELGVSNFAGWKVYFIVKKTLQTLNTDAVINLTINLDANTGTGSGFLTDEQTAAIPVGEYIYGAKLVDSSGNVAHTDVGVFTVEDVAYKGATA